jgi:hypothetical protein
VFAQSGEEVSAAIEKELGLNSLVTVRPDTHTFHLRSGRFGWITSFHHSQSDGVGCWVDVHESPSWLRDQIEALRRFLHPK